MRPLPSPPTIPWAEHGADLAALLAACGASVTRRLGPELCGAVLARASRAPGEAPQGPGAGDRVLDEGAVLTPASIALLRSAGVTAVEVREPIEAVVLGGRRTETAAGCGAWLRTAGARVTMRPEQDLAAQRREADDVLGAADLLVTVGHAEDPERARALGPRDGLIGVRVAMEPGGLQGIGTMALGDRRVAWVDLPADPVAALVACETLLRPALRAARPPGLRRPVVLESPMASEAGVLTVLPVRLLPSGSLRPVLLGDGSRRTTLAGLAHADALATIPEDVTEVRSGDTLEVSLLPFRESL